MLPGVAEVISAAQGSKTQIAAIMDNHDSFAERYAYIASVERSGTARS